jgi:PAS domain S-box-containing protein
MIGSSDILKAKILIVDDQAPNVVLLEEMLRGAGYVSIASTMDPNTVCELHRKNRYDLILLDLQMPGMDGFQVMENLKEIETSGYLPVLVVTAQPAHKLGALKAGAKDFVSKPFDLPEVLLRVYNMLEVRLLHLNETRNHARLENSQRIAGVGDWEYDFTLRRMIWSEEVYQILGIPVEDSPPDAETFYDRVHPADLAFIHREKKAAREELRRVSLEHRVIRPNGEVRYIHQIIETIVDDHGQPLRESGTVQDITERKRAQVALRLSEERFKLVARAVSDVVWDWDLSMNTLWWTEGFLNTFGFVASEVGLGIESWSNRIHSEERGQVVESIHRAIDDGSESWTAEYRFRRKDGSHAFVQDRGYILRDATGKGVRMVGGIRDLTQQKKMEVQYLRAQRMDTLAGSIAHSLNSVLAPIMMSIDVLKLGSVDAKRRGKILDTIDGSCRRGADLVRQIVSFARGLDDQQSTIQPRNLFSDLEGVISETFPSNIHIVTEVPNDLWPITGNPTQLHQVLHSLAVKARDAMSHGGTLTLTATNLTIDSQYAGTSQEAKAGPHVCLQITDTGIGIPPEVVNRTFEPFFTTKELGKDTGIGLATVDAVVKSHGGFLNVENEVGQGTTFKIYLPADPSLHSDEKETLHLELPHGRGELVLVADEDFSIRDITQQTLEAYGYRVITASDGADAIALYARQAKQIGVVLIDLRMPVIDGAATIEVLMRIDPTIKIIATSGIDSGDDAAKAAYAGVKHLLPKPYPAETLVKLLREVLDSPTLLLVAQ